MFSLVVINTSLLICINYIMHENEMSILEFFFFTSLTTVLRIYNFFFQPIVQSTKKQFYKEKFLTFFKLLIFCSKLIERIDYTKIFWLHTFNLWLVTFIQQAVFLSSSAVQIFPEACWKIIFSLIFPAFHSTRLSFLVSFSRSMFCVWKSTC